jgi:cytochrome c peroxidase
VIGALDSVRAVLVRVTARDAYGGSTTGEFILAAPAADPGEPALPSISYVYDDARLPLPADFAFSREHFAPLWDTTPDDNPTSDAGATLGRVLFYDKRLSITNTHSCASCHRQERGFAAEERFSSGVMGVPLTRNAMGLTNVRFNFDDLFFIDLRTPTLEKLALQPIEAPLELGNHLPLLEQKLAATSFYGPLFEAAFGTPQVTRDRIARALAQFLRSLLSYRSKFDRAYSMMNGQDPPIPDVVFTAQERRGDLLFKNQVVGGAHCSNCHVGTVQTLDRPSTNGLDAESPDPGGPNGVFRSASLRNIAVTGPYMHDGRFTTLREVIDHYDHGVQQTTPFRLPFPLLVPTGDAPRRLNLSEEDKAALEAFLHTLTDDEFLTDPRFADPFQ